MLHRRDCLRLLGGGLPAAALIGGPSFPTTVADRVDKRYKAPGPRPVGIHALLDGIWVLDAETSKAYLMQYGSGTVKEEIEIPAGGLTCLAVDTVGLWIGADDGRRILRIEWELDPETGRKTGETRKKGEWETPGSGPVMWRAGEPGRTMGVQGMAWGRGELFLATPSLAAIQVFRVQDGSVLRTMAAPGIRPEGLAWDTDGKLWCLDSNSRSFFKMDSISGQIIKQHMLPFAEPAENGLVIAPHGITIWQRMIYFCSPDTGDIYRTPLVNRMS